MSVSCLGSMIENAACAQVDNYLRELSNTSETELFKELTTRDKNGMTPLHLAVIRGDFHMVKVLLSFDAPTGDVENYAKELMEKRSDKEQLQRVYTLIKSRGRWQSAAVREHGLLFSRSMKVVEDVVPKIEGAAQKIGLLFAGKTGEGKSTLINYFKEVDYTSSRVEGIKRLMPLSPEIVKTGHTTTSETLYPQVVSWKGQQQVLVDLPGFGDTRGIAEEICAAASIYMLTQQLDAIQTIFFVCSWKSLKNSKMLGYREAAHPIGAMISANSTTEANLILVVTKPNSKTTVEFVRNRLLELKAAEGWNVPEAVKPEDMTSEAGKKYCLRKVTEVLLTRKDSILLADVLTPHGRDEFKKVVKSLKRQAKNPALFNFSTYSLFMERFKGMLIKHMQHRLEMAHHLSDLSESLKELMNAAQDEQSKINLLQKKYDSAIQLSNRAFDKSSYEKLINNIKQNILNKKSSLTSLSYSKLSDEGKAREIRNQIVSLEATRSEKKETSYEGLATDSAVLDKIYEALADSSKTGSKYTFRIWLIWDEARCSYEDLINQFTIHVQKHLPVYSNDCPVYNYELWFNHCMAKQGTSASREAIKGYMFASIYPLLMKGLLNHLKYSFKLVIVRDSHQQGVESHSRSQDLSVELRTLENSITNYQKSIWNIRDQIRQEEYQAAVETSKMESARMSHETQASAYRARAIEVGNQINKLKGNISLLKLEQEKICQDIKLAQMELDVNQDLFSQIYKINLLMNFHDEIVERFNAAINSSG